MLSAATQEQHETTSLILRLENAAAPSPRCSNKATSHQSETFTSNGTETDLPTVSTTRKICQVSVMDRKCLSCSLCSAQSLDGGFTLYMFRRYQEDGRLCLYSRACVLQSVNVNSPHSSISTAGSHSYILSTCILPIWTALIDLSLNYYSSPRSLSPYSFTSSLHHVARTLALCSQMLDHYPNPSCRSLHCYAHPSSPPSPACTTRS
jgi:hypothetical protein